MKIFRWRFARRGLLLVSTLGLICALYSSTTFLQAQDAALLGSISTARNIDAVALTPNAGTAYGIQSEEKALYIFDLITHSIKKKITLERKPVALAVNSTTNAAYITAMDDKKKGMLYKVDSDENSSSLDIAKDPSGIALDPDRNELVIAIEQDMKLLILTLDGLVVKGTISLPHRPRMVAFDSAANRAVVVAGEAAGEGKQDRMLVVDLSTGNILQNIRMQQKVNALAVDSEKNKAVVVSMKEVNVMDIDTGTVFASFKADQAAGVDINQATHTAVITGEAGYQLYDLTSGRIDQYRLGYGTIAVAVDQYRNTALICAKDKVVEIQLPNPAPEITKLTPKSTRIGEPGFTLKVEGLKFIATSVVKFNNNSVSTTFRDNTELEAFIPAGLITSPGTVDITVTNPTPAGGTSEPFSFTILFPVPALASLSPDSIPARNADFTITVTGSQFMQGDTVVFNGQALRTTYVKATTMKAVVPSLFIQTKGLYLVTVVTPDGVSSNSLNFTVMDNYPVIAGFSPTEGSAGDLITLVGSNFNKPPVTVYFNGVKAVLTNLSDNELKALVPFGLKSGPITVQTAIGSAESSVPFDVRLRQDFELSISPQVAAIPENGKASFTVSLVNKGTEPFTGLAKLSIVNYPSGVTGSFNPGYISLNQSAVLTLSSTQGTLGQVAIQGSARVADADLAKIAIILLNPAAPGATTLRGQILATKDAGPIAGVTVKLGTQTAITDGGGNFVIDNPSPGNQVVMVNGDTANHDGISYPSALPVPVTIVSGANNALPYPVYLHEVKTSYFTQIDPSRDTIVTDPEIPNYDMLIPAGVVITGLDGQPNTKVSVKPIPVDRLPIKPPPDGVYASEIYMYYFFKPGGGTPSKPIAVKMPNSFQASPGTRVNLWYYDESFTPDPNSNQWKSFGMGTVGSDGRNIIPDPGVGIPKFCCGASFPSPLWPSGNPASPPDSICQNQVADPVDAYTGMFTYARTDMEYPAPSKLQITRLYNSGNTTIGSFGLGSTMNYNYFLQGSEDAFTYIPPEGGQYILSKNADESYTNINYPFLRGSKAYLNADGTRSLILKNGETYKFDAAGRLITITDPNNNLIAIVRDSFGNITGLADSFGREVYVSTTTVQIGLAIYTLISSLTDMAGQVTAYGYDSNARLTSVTQPDGSMTTYSYDGYSRLKSATNPRGLAEVLNQYDGAGRIIQQTHADGGVFSIAYNVVGGNVTQTAVTAPNGGTTTYRFNGSGYSSDITDAFGQKTTYTRAFGTNDLNSMTDPLGRTTSYTYDANGNIAAITDPAGNVTRYEYETVFNKPTKMTDALGNITTLTYDAKGNLTQIQSPKSELTIIGYNSNGLPVSLTNALGNISTFEYDEFGNLVKATDPLGNSAQLEYDFIGRMISATDPKGKTTLYSYDDLNRIKEISDALNNKTGFTYDANNNLLTVTDAKSQTITYTYSVRDKVATMTDQLGKTESYFYDQNDNVISVTDRKGQATTYQYDSMNRIIKTTYADGSTTTYTYDAVGRLTYINDAVSGPIEYVYGNMGCAACGGAVDKVIKEITPHGSISYTYDTLGRRVSMTVAGQPTVNYNYDADSHLADINTVINETYANFGMQYDLLGRRTSLALPNGVTTTYVYDNASRLLNLEHLNSLSQVFEQIGYAYDSNGNRTRMDRINIPAKLPNPTTNIIYNAANQMLMFDDKTIVHDANGNMTTLTNACGTTTYTWDARNGLIGINGFNADCAALSASFKYDAWGRRNEKIINGKTMQYLYNGRDIVQEIDGGTVAENYIRSANIDEPLARIKSDGTVRYYQTDALGSVIALTDETGLSKTQYVYDPFGNVSTTGDVSDNPFQYTGRENDGTALYYYRARYYSPELRRFISEDPIGLAGGINFYSYVGNNPVNFIDPLGLWGLTIGLEGAGGIAGFGGVIGVYGNFAHDPSQSWYSGWSSSATFVLGGGAMATVYGLTGGVHGSVNSACNVSQLNGGFLSAGRLGLGAFSASGYQSPNGTVTGGGLTIGPSLPGGYIGGFAGGTNTWTISGGNW